MKQTKNEASDPCHLLDCTKTNIFVYEFEMRFLIKACCFFFAHGKLFMMKFRPFIIAKLYLRDRIFENLCLFYCDV